MTAQATTNEQIRSPRLLLAAIATMLLLASLGSILAGQAFLTLFLIAALAACAFAPSVLTVEICPEIRVGPRRPGQGH
jgi:hypothetical protein